MVIALIDRDLLIAVLSGLLTAIAGIHLLLAFGWRRGTLAWGSYHPRRLPTDLRRRSLGFGLLLLASALLLPEVAGLEGLGVMPVDSRQATGFVLTSFLGVAGLYIISRNNVWERFLFGPILMLGSITAGLLTFRV